MVASDPVERWQSRLAERVGMTGPERARLRAGLERYCARHDVTPSEVLRTWRQRPELTVRRRHARAETPNLAVESFLIHNGVNVFGDIVCVPGTPEQLAEQGSWFTRQERR